MAPGEVFADTFNDPRAALVSPVLEFLPRRAALEQCRAPTVQGYREFGREGGSMGNARLNHGGDRRRPNLLSRLGRAGAAAPRAPAAWTLGGLGFILVAALLANAVAETTGCARCGGGESSPTVGFAPPSAGFRTFSRLEAPRRRIRLESAGKREAGGGAYTVCVRTCDGSFFPVTYLGSRSRADSLEEVCRAQCPSAEVKLYAFPLGGAIDEAVSTTGEPYDSLPNAHKFERSYDSSCSCRRPAQSWAEALAAAEARYGHYAHDILVTPEKSAEMSRPIGAPRIIAARAEVTKDAATMTDESEPLPLELDINGVDTKLSAAAASISRETSGIKDESAERPAVYRLNDGQTVEEKAPDGSPRRVRIIAPAF
jgi:hypothetical protein